MKDEAARHVERLGKLTPKTLVPLGVVTACLLVLAGGIWKLAFATSDLFHEVKEMHEAQSNFITVSEMETWQGELKFNLLQVGQPLAGAVPSIRTVVNEARRKP